MYYIQEQIAKLEVVSKKLKFGVDLNQVVASIPRGSIPNKIQYKQKTLANASQNNISNRKLVNL